MRIIVSPEKVLLVEAAMPGTRDEIVERTGVSASTASSVVRNMRDDGEAYICGWRGHAPVYCKGQGEDAPRLNGFARLEVKQTDSTYTLNARIDLMIWRTAGRKPPHGEQP